MLSESVLIYEPSGFLAGLYIFFPDIKTTNSIAFSLHANCTDWATATCWPILVPTFADRGVSRGQRGGSLTVVNIRFLDRFFLILLLEKANLYFNKRNWTFQVLLCFVWKRRIVTYWRPVILAVGHLSRALPALMMIDARQGSTARHGTRFHYYSTCSPVYKCEIHLPLNLHVYEQLKFKIHKYWLTLTCFNYVISEYIIAFGFWNISG
jgi:hypothetical protein